MRQFVWLADLAGGSWRYEDTTYLMIRICEYAKIERSIYTRGNFESTMLDRSRYAMSMKDITTKLPCPLFLPHRAKDSEVECVT